MRGDVTTVLAGWLLTYLVHSTVLLGAVALVTRWRGISLGARELLWKSAMLAALATATIQTSSTFAPAGRLSIAPAVPETVRRAATPVTPAAATPSSETVAVPTTALEVSQASTAPFYANWDWRTVFVATWASVAAVLLLGLVVGRLRLLRRIGRRDSVTDWHLVNIFTELCDTADIRPEIKLTSSTSLASPVALGPREICLPFPGMASLMPEQQRGVLAHELAHVVRRDPMWLGIALVLERVFFLQPLNFMARRELQISAEYLCDDWAARQVGNGLPLARCLLRVAEWLAGAPGPHPAPAMAAHGSHLLRRVERLIKGTTGDGNQGRRLAVAMAGALVAATLVVAPAVTADVRQPSKEESETERSDEPTLTEQKAWPSASPSVTMALTTSRAPEKAPKDEPVSLDIGAPTGGVDARSKMEKDVSTQDTTKSKKVIAALTSALRDADPTVRAAAAEALGRLGDASAAGDLANALRDPEPKVQRQATFALAELEDPRAVEPLIAATTLADAEVRQKAADALGNLEDQRALPALQKLLSDQNVEVRKSAINALSNFELTSAPEALLAALRDPSGEVRHEAAHTIGHIGDRRAVPALKVLLDDPNRDVRDAAVEALHEIGDEAALQALIGALKAPYPEVRRAAAEALGQKKD